MKTIDIETAIAREFNYRNNLIVPCVSWGFDIHECDILICSKAGYLTEIEIKISKSDLLAEKKKAHKHNDNRIKSFYYAVPIEMKDYAIELIPENAGLLSARKSESGLVTIKTEKNCIPNKNAKPIEIYEQYKLARLGAIKIWTLKEKLKLKYK